MANGAVLFNGSSDYLSFAHWLALDGASKAGFTCWFKPINPVFYGTMINAQGAGPTGTGNDAGMAILQTGGDATSLFVAARNGSSANAAQSSGVVSTAGFQAFVVNYDGTQASPADRVACYVANTYLSGVTDSSAPTTLGTNNQPILFGTDCGFTLWNNCVLADIAIRAGGIWSAPEIAGMASGMSAGNYISGSDRWWSFRTGFNADTGQVATVGGSPTLTTGPSLTYPSAGGPIYTQLERGIRGLNRGICLGAY